MFAGLAAVIALALPGCASREIMPQPVQPTSYTVIGQITRSRTGATSNEDTPYKLEVKTLFGKQYLTIEEPLSATGFALSDLRGVTQAIGNGRVDLETRANSTYVARPAKRADGEPATTLPLRTNGPYGVRAQASPIQSSNPVEVTTIPGPDYNIKTITIDGKTFFSPFRQLSPKETGVAPFYMIPKSECVIKIDSDGQISLVNRGKILEWIAKDEIAKQLKAEQEKAELEAKKKQEEAEQKEEQRKRQGLGSALEPI